MTNKNSTLQSKYEKKVNILATHNFVTKTTNFPCLMKKSLVSKMFQIKDAGIVRAIYILHDYFLD